MGNTIELTCGHCGKRVIIPDGEPGAIYTCPHCSGQNRAAHQAGTNARSTATEGYRKSWDWKHWTLLVLALGFLCAGAGIFSAAREDVHHYYNQCLQLEEGLDAALHEMKGMANAIRADKTASPELKRRAEEFLDELQSRNPGL